MELEELLCYTGIALRLRFLRCELGHYLGRSHILNACRFGTAAGVLSRRLKSRSLGRGASTSSRCNAIPTRHVAQKKPCPREREFRCHRGSLNLRSEPGLVVLHFLPILLETASRCIGDFGLIPWLHAAAAILIPISVITFIVVVIFLK